MLHPKPVTRLLLLNRKFYQYPELLDPRKMQYHLKRILLSILDLTDLTGF